MRSSSLRANMARVRSDSPSPPASMTRSSCHSMKVGMYQRSSTSLRGRQSASVKSIAGLGWLDRARPHPEDLDGAGTTDHPAIAREPRDRSSSLPRWIDPCLGIYASAIRKPSISRMEPVRWVSGLTTTSTRSPISSGSSPGSSTRWISTASAPSSRTAPRV